MDNTKCDIGIVGGGVSGALLAIQLLRRAPKLSIAVIDKGALPGRGIAYATKYCCHVLNVPACNMSALPEEPNHFLEWARANFDPSVEPMSFLPRSIYGRYVGSFLDVPLERGSEERLRWIHGEVLCISPGRSLNRLRLADGNTLNAQIVVFCLGNFPPANPRIPGLSESSTRYVTSPWSDNALSDIPRNGGVLLIGSGLTSVDQAVALSSQGFAGQIYFLSRHGLLPQAHWHVERYDRIWDNHYPMTTRALFRVVRERVRQASRSGVDWREVIDRLRPATQRIWQSLPQSERKRFLRHLRSYWDVHRHRIAPEIANTIADLVHEQRAIIYSGRLIGYREFADRAEIEFRDRKTSNTCKLSVDRVINCTGPATDCRHVEHPLIQSLLAQGLARPDPLFLGLDVDSRGALLDGNGRPSSSLYVIGPLRKGFLWETIAVPELRVQASTLAGHLATGVNPIADPAIAVMASGYGNHEGPLP